jgi:hypothetical protein
VKRTSQSARPTARRRARHHTGGKNACQADSTRRRRSTTQRAHRHSHRKSDCRKDSRRRSSSRSSRQEPSPERCAASGSGSTNCCSRGSGRRAGSTSLVRSDTPPRYARSWGREDRAEPRRQEQGRLQTSADHRRQRRERSKLCRRGRNGTAQPPAAPLQIRFFRQTLLVVVGRNSVTGHLRALFAAAAGFARRGRKRPPGETSPESHHGSA